jgi:hypothetical protein
LVGKLELIANVLRIRRYAMISIVTGTILGILYLFLTMSLLPTHFGVAFDFSPFHITTSIIITVIISILAGINFALVAYKMQRMKMMNSVKSNSTAVLGGIFGMFTPGCPACTAPLAVVLASVGGLSLFPLQGLEMKFVSVAVLVFSIYWITRKIQSNSCCTIK